MLFLQLNSFCFAFWCGWSLFQSVLFFTAPLAWISVCLSRWWQKASLGKCFTLWTYMPINSLFQEIYCFSQSRKTATWYWFRSWFVPGYLSSVPFPYLYTALILLLFSADCTSSTLVGALQCSPTEDCINLVELCDGVKNCNSGADEGAVLCGMIIKTIHYFFLV